MRILIVSNLYPPSYRGGYELLCSQVCGLLGAAGHDVCVLTSVTGSEREAPAQPGVTVKRLLALSEPFGLPAERGVMRQLGLWRRNGRATARVIDGWAPDIVFLWSQLRLTTGPAAAAEASQLPVAYTFNDAYLLGMQPPPPGRSARALARILWDRCLPPELTTRGLQLRHTTCISRLLKRNLLTAGLPVAEANIIYQGVPLGLFPSKPDPGSQGDSLRLLYAGQLHDYKGVHTVIEAAHRLAARRGRGRVSVTIVGAGSQAYTRQLQVLAASGPAPVRFTGKQPYEQMPAIYRNHDVFVFPSIWEEPFGLTHLEAMASGTTVIGTLHGGQGEFLEPGVNALAFDATDAGGLAGGLERLLDDPQLCRRLGREGRRTVAERFSLDRYVDELWGFLTSVVRAGSNRFVPYAAGPCVAVPRSVAVGGLEGAGG